jgi:hypothetical protein
MDECELSFVAGRIRVAFYRDETLIDARMLDVAAAQELADQLEGTGNGDGSEMRIGGGVVLERAYAQLVGRQLRDLALVLQSTREFWAAAGSGQAPRSPPGGRTPGYS